MSWAEIGARSRSAHITEPEALPGVGDEAYVYHYYDNRDHHKQERTHIVYRLDNLVVEVSYTAIDGLRDEKGIRQGARMAADWTIATLKRTG